jgi:hypothetical protein
MNISKELLSEVFGRKVSKISKAYHEINHRVYIDFEYKSLDQGVGINIDIHALANKCKEWILDLDIYWFEIEFTPRWYVITIKDYDNRGVVYQNGYYTEPEAIFQACQYILENKNDN